jgi:hypothetical protein
MVAIVAISSTYRISPGRAVMHFVNKFILLSFAVPVGAMENSMMGQTGGLILECNTQTEVEDAIFEEVHKKQYTLAKKAPICSGKLFEDFECLAITPVL